MHIKGGYTSVGFVADTFYNGMDKRQYIEMSDKQDQSRKEYRLRLKTISTDLSHAVIYLDGRHAKVKLYKDEDDYLYFKRDGYTYYILVFSADKFYVKYSLALKTKVPPYTLYTFMLPYCNIDNLRNLLLKK